MHLDSGMVMDGKIYCAHSNYNQWPMTVHNMRWFEMVGVRGHIEDGAVAHWQVTIKIGFALEK